jgi:hypothetical protein
VEHLFNAKQKERSEKAQKKKKRVFIPIVRATGEGKAASAEDDERPTKKQKTEERDTKEEEKSEDEVILEGEGLAGLLNY